MSLEECKQAASRRGFGRKWLGPTDSPGEASGCIMWEDGNVEFNRKLDQQSCNVRGTCLCRRPDGSELQVVGGAMAAAM